MVFRPWLLSVKWIPTLPSITQVNESVKWATDLGTRFGEEAPTMGYYGMKHYLCWSIEWAKEHSYEWGVWMFHSERDMEAFPSKVPCRYCLSICILPAFAFFSILILLSVLFIPRFSLYHLRLPTQSILCLVGLYPWFYAFIVYQSCLCWFSSLWGWHRIPHIYSLSISLPVYSMGIPLWLSVFCPWFYVSSQSVVFGLGLEFFNPPSFYAVAVLFPIRIY
jgi:hypothetical protein